MNLLRFWKMLKKYSQQSFYLETHPRLAIIPPDFQLNSQNSITLLSLRSVPEKRTIQFKESELETGASRGDFAAISIPRHGYVGGSRSSIRLDPADLRNKISGWTHIFVSVGWRSLFAPSIHRVRSSAHNPRRATVSRVVRFNVAASRFVPRFDTRAPVRRALFARVSTKTLCNARCFEGETERQLSLWKKKKWKGFVSQGSKYLFDQFPNIGLMLVLFRFVFFSLSLSLYVRHFHFIHLIWQREISFKFFIVFFFV